MGGGGGAGWLVRRDGRLRTPWRVLLFVVLFIVIVWLELLVLSAVTVVPVPGDHLSAALVAQSAVLLIAALLAGRAMLRWVDRRPDVALGFALDRTVPRALALGLVAGGAALGLVVAALALVGAYGYGPDGGSPGGWLTTAVTSLLVLALPAAAEEALFRGYPFRVLVEGAGAGVAIVVTSAVFAWVHGGNPGAGPLALVNIFLAGVLLAVAVLRTGTLWFATAVHLGWNWAMAGPLDLPVSGLGGLDMPLYDVVDRGPAWLTGGAFGPEGGLAGTLALGAGLALVGWMTRPGARLAGTLNGSDDGRDR